MILPAQIGSGCWATVYPEKTQQETANASALAKQERFMVILLGSGGGVLAAAPNSPALRTRW